MRFTTLRVTEAGVILFAHHEQRLAPEPGPVRDRFLAFAKHAYPGVYAIRVIGGELLVEWRAASRLVDGMPTRTLPSPFADRTGAFAKPPPEAYAGVRLDGTVTLLALPDGTLAESCSAAIASVRDGRLVLVPEASPRVDSGAERELARAFDAIRAPLPADGVEPLLLVNAVKLTCTVDAPNRAPFPEDLRRTLDAHLLATARRA